MGPIQSSLLNVTLSQHASTTRLRLRKGRGENRICTVVRGYFTLQSFFSDGRAPVNVTDSQLPNFASTIPLLFPRQTANSLWDLLESVTHLIRVEMSRKLNSILRRDVILVYI